ncbi:hypothetical protein SAMN06265361_101680 [Laceyella tengchongensis]|uniref:Uncharacterized protein n=1 Tax=Laceyella tengchongensis TaxID=574699 RepID=A0AA46ADL1_9BACL|nr:hypothetical protein SAMN06265361_101680 [Laceyella tengchongensis]
MKKRLWRALRKSFPMTLRWFMAMIFLLYGGVKLVFGQFGHIPLNEITQVAAQKGGIRHHLGFFWLFPPL